jgi:hypothetical protein
MTQSDDSYITEEELARRFPLPVIRSLVVDGVACVYCGEMDGPMTPSGIGPRGQLFVHVGACPIHPGGLGDDPTR